jgi:hypothetical protein
MTLGGIMRRAVSVALAGVAASLFVLAGLVPVASVAAQSPVRLKSLEISLWPEYDQAGVLVIYRGQLADDVNPPVRLTFLIPASAGKPSSTAGVDDSGQFRYRSYTMEQSGDFLAVSYDCPYRSFQMEYYYDPLTTSGSQRTFSDTVRVDYDTAALVLEVQEPAASSNFSMTPAPTQSDTGSDGLKLDQAVLGGQTQGATIPVQVSYQKSDERLSATILGLAGPGTAQFEDVATPSNNALAYALLGAAATLLLGAAAFVIYQSRTRKARALRAAPAVGAGSRRPRPRPRAVSGGGARYCRNCGAVLRENALFCAKCGTKVK